MNRGLRRATVRSLDVTGSVSSSRLVESTRRTTCVSSLRAGRWWTSSQLTPPGVNAASR